MNPIARAKRLIEGWHHSLSGRRAADLMRRLLRTLDQLASMRTLAAIALIAIVLFAEIARARPTKSSPQLELESWVVPPDAGQEDLFTRVVDNDDLTGVRHTLSALSSSSMCMFDDSDYTELFPVRNESGGVVVIALSGVHSDGEKIDQRASVIHPQYLHLYSWCQPSPYVLMETVVREGKSNLRSTGGYFP